MTKLLFDGLLPIYSVAILLELNGQLHLPYFHQQLVHRFNKQLMQLDDAQTQFMHIEAAESGQLSYTAGDRYAYGIHCYAMEKAPFQHLFTRLTQLKEPTQPFATALGSQLSLIRLTDLVSAQTITKASQLQAFNQRQLKELIKHWQSSRNDYPRQIDIHIKSPTRIARNDYDIKVLNLQGDEALCRDITQISISLLLQQLVARFNQNLPEQPVQLSKEHIEQVALAFRIKGGDLFWVDTENKQTTDNTNITNGGMIGYLQIEQIAPTEDWVWEALILGQYLGIGAATHLGFGQYHIQFSNIPTHHLQPQVLQPSQSLLSKALRLPNIRSATKHLEKKSKQEALADKFQQQLDKALDELHDHRYTAPPLFAQEIPKKNGGTRLLAVAPLYDRILQKAIAMQLTPSIDALLYQSSYAYRKGRSRLDVKNEIQQAIASGRHWIYESDVSRFFDEIDRNQLKLRLASLFADDPIVEAVNGWLSADIIIDGVRHARAKGIPQGSPLSPLMANFMLDDFDSDLISKGFHLIRYADDFVIMCENQIEAEFAAEEVKRSLNEIGLSINQAKSHIKSVNDGFQFVGYIFQADVSIDTNNVSAKMHPLTDEAGIWGEDEFSDDFLWQPESPTYYSPITTTTQLSDNKSTTFVAEAAPIKKPTLSVNESAIADDDEWLPWEGPPRFHLAATQHDAEQAHNTTKNTAIDNSSQNEADTEDEANSLDELAETSVDFSNLLTDLVSDNVVPSQQTIANNQAQPDNSDDESFGQMPNEGTFFTLAGESSLISLNNGRFVISQDEIVIQSIPLIHISGVLLFGNHHLTTPLMKACLAAQIPIHFATRMGKYEGALWNQKPIDNSYKLWLTQLAVFEDSAHALHLAKLTVASRITNMTSLLKRYTSFSAVAQCIRQHNEALKNLNQADSLASLLGHEGNATKNYYQALTHLVPSWCEFDSRNRRPPKDPFNVLLSYGYTWLYAHIDAILTARGFLTWKGYYHQQSSGHAALASDMVESYRHLIERVALTCVNNKIIQLDDFRIEDEQLRLSSEGRKRYIRQLESYFDKEQQSDNIWQHIHQQAASLNLYLQSEGDYLPFTNG